MTVKKNEKPLSGITVLDFTHAAAGPFCTMLLADFGARVLKVEKPGRGDGSRHMRMHGKFKDADIGSDYYLGVNRNKYSIGLDLSTEEGADIARQLAGKCDVLVENYRPGVMDKLGLGYEELSASHPGLIYCDISAFPLDGPLADEPGMDIVAQARAGTIACTGHMGGEPVKPGPSLADFSAGQQACIGVLMALRTREQSGKGQRVDVSLYDATLLILSNYASVLLNTEEDLEPMGSGHPQIVPYQAFPTADRWMFIAVGTNGLWRRLCKGLNIEWAIEDERYATNWARVENRADCVSLLSDIFQRQNRDHWLELLKNAGVPASPIVTPREAYQTELERSSHIVATVEHPDYGPTHVPGLSIRLSDTPGSIYRYPPRLGDDTDAILKEFVDLDPGEMETLAQKDIIRQYQGGSS